MDLYGRPWVVCGPFIDESEYSNDPLIAFTFVILSEAKNDRDMPSHDNNEPLSSITHLHCFCNLHQPTSKKSLLLGIKTQLQRLLVGNSCIAHAAGPAQ